MTRYSWRAHKIERQTPDSVTIHFDTGNYDFEYQPGQFINLNIAIDGRTISRSYSLCSAPGLNERPAITVKAIHGGVVSNHIVSFAEQIASWDVTGAFGTFSPSRSTKQVENIVLIAGGSGVTPLWSIAKSLLHQTSSRVYLLYSSRSENSVLFKEELASYVSRFPERLTVKHVYSRGGGASPRGGGAKSQRLSEQGLNTLLQSILDGEVNNAHYFICGPEGLMQTANKVLTSNGVPKEAVHQESFSNTESTDSPRLEQLTTFEVLLHAGDRSSLIEVRPDESILDAALKEHIPLYYSCKSGSCGNCIAKVLVGKVQMSRNLALSESQIAEGYTLLCQSHPLGNDVTIEAEADWKDVLEVRPTH